MFDSIVVGTDGSDTAGEAVRQAAELAARLGARVHLVCAYEPSSTVDGVAATAVDADADGWELGPREAVEATLASAAEVFAAAAVPVEQFARRGDAADAIIDVAEERGAELIIVGSKGTTGAKRFLLGSVPNRISHHAPCAVLIIRTA
jgi:nucleotide-binding universal stress UspA family protein